MRVLITRPAYVAEGLSQKIKNLNAIPELLPTIEIRSTPHQQTLALTIQKLNTAHIAIFISRAAVHFGMNVIKQHWHPLPSIQWAAIGPGTAEALQQHHVDSVIVPKFPPYETESLLQLKIFQTIKAKKIFIFRGNGGRPLLNQTLKERGAIVELVEVYQRTLPTIDIVEKLTTWRHNPIDVIVTTSMECLNNLLLLMGPNEAKDY